ncbi:hypothetical protein PRIPAC_77048 [Pristionchus pacificus]|uniref:EB domain-containing protein n=1 Tax=Pristionchus pacificus TaxID=54126 RepID=A0A2A6CNV5_PRIPA|nr:hypothetical protein PRIPAC_77048 [Pristionchus pacificus]|eukprot:PDM79757.1 hypothetical protein PRIPAC_32336 [Pristionchus pacificus]
MWILLVSSILVATVLTATQEKILHQQVATCPRGKVLVNGQCISVAAPGSACTASQQCIDSSTCVNNICTCADYEAYTDRKFDSSNTSSFQ